MSHLHIFLHEAHECLAQFLAHPDGIGVIFLIQYSVVEEGFKDVEGLEFWESGEMEDEETVEIGEKARTVIMCHTDGGHEGIVCLA